MPPCAITELNRAIADAKACIERGEPDLLAAMCRDILPWAGQADVDRTLGRLLKLTLRHASATSVAEIEAKAFPLDRLQKGWNPQDASIAYLDWKYRQTVQRQGNPDLGQVRILVSAGQALWPYLDEPTRLLHGLHVKLGTAYAALGEVRSLCELGQELLAGPLNDERQQAAVIRIIKQLQRARADEEIACLLDRLLTRSDHNAALIEISLTAVTDLSKSAQRLSDHQRLGLLVSRLVLWLQQAGARLHDERLVKVLIRCAEFDQLHKLLPHLLDNLADSDVRSVLLATLEQLFRYEMLGEAGQYIERVYRYDPGDVTAALLFGRFLLQGGMSHHQIVSILEPVRADAARYDEVVMWIAELYYVEAEYEQVIRWLDTHPLHEPDKVRSLLNRVHAALNRPPLPQSADAEESERISVHRLGPLAPLLMPLVHALNGDLSHTGHPTLEELHDQLHTVMMAVFEATQSNGSVTPHDCLSAVRELTRAVRIHLRDMVEQQRGSPVMLGPQHGAMDSTRVMLVFENSLRVAMKLSEFGIEMTLRDAPLVDVRDLCQLVERHMESAFALNESQASERLLEALRNRRVVHAFVLRLLERCALQRGDICAAAALVSGQSGMSGEMFSLEPFDTWARLEAVRSEVLVSEEPWKGAFEYRDSKGHLHQAPHEVPPTRVDLVYVSDLRVRDSEVLIGPKGSIPRPHPWHFRDFYGYPRASSIRLNYGHSGCRLRSSCEKLHVLEPLVVLMNMDGPLWRNYYHWMLPILTRVAVLLDRDVFEHRRLLVPAELSGWMNASLELVGLPEERMLRYTAEQEVQVDDAMVVGPVEFSAAALIKPLQRRLWTTVGVDLQKAVSGRALWLSRRHQHRRYLANEDAVEAMVERLGFDVIVPESLPLVEQVRLCANASAIAGSAGANLTNLMFARPGTPLLGLVGEDNNYPTFVDLCAILDLPQRWVFGRMDPRKSWWGTYHEPFEVDLNVLEHELQRLIEVSQP